MAKPQAEDGHIDIANELAEAFAAYFPGRSEAQILWAILRKTYGWHKKEDKISIGQIEQMTGLSRRMVIYSIQNLEAKKIIIVKRVRGRGNINEPNLIGLQKNYDLWVVQEKSKQYDKALKSRKKYYIKSKKEVVQEIEGSARKAKKVVQEIENKGGFLAPTKETITKENTKEISSVFLSLSNLLQELILFNNPKAKITDSQIKNWSNTIRLMIERDNRTPEEIQKIIEFSQCDDFWKSNILSMDKLRKQFDQLTLKQQSEKPPPEKPVKLYTPEPSPTKEQIENNQKRVKELIKSL